MKNQLDANWNLDTIFPGGSDSAQFETFLDSLDQEIASFREALNGTKAEQLKSVRELAALAQNLQTILVKLEEAGSFCACLAAQNDKDKKAILLGGRVQSMRAEYASSLTRMDQLLDAVPDGQWAEWMNSNELSAIRFALNERRKLAAEKLSPEMESLINELSVDGYHAWNNVYDTTVAGIKIPYEEDGETRQLSAGQFFNKLLHPEAAVRHELFERWERAWAEQADFCAEALNRLAGFRLKVYDRRGWDSVHKEPLALNRMSRQTLQVMWDVISRNKPVFADYMNKKAKLLGKEKLDWNDVEAPVGESGGTISYAEGAQLIYDQFKRFSPKMADFAQRAFEDRWIEAEDRPGKRPGGFCTSFPVKGETRIFMTYSGTASNVSTLAHELGHGYHQHVMTDMPALAQQYAMNVAETASTFAEMIVSDAVVKAAANPMQKLNLLDDKISRSIVFYMNIHARFIFETNFYEERRKGLVSVEKLNGLMVDAQKEAFQDALGQYHPHFWAAKLHFYSTDVPFYNFPYTFGYLFSTGIYAAAIKQGAGFEQKYEALLRDTASMTVEELALKHLGVNLTQPEFWQDAVNLTIADVHEFNAVIEDLKV